MPETPEQLARRQIDAQLIASGWVVQDYRQFNPSAGRGIALREVPLKSGTCDYLVLVDRKAVGVAEAKKPGTLLSGVAEQSGHYAENLPEFIQSIAPGSLPFLYESTGAEERPEAGCLCHCVFESLAKRILRPYRSFARQFAEISGVHSGLEI